MEDALQKEVKYLSLGSLVYNIFVLLIYIVVAIINKFELQTIVTSIVSIIAGFSLSIALIHHMAESINTSIDIEDDRKRANYIKNRSVIRFFIIVAVALILGYKNSYASLMFIISVFGMKFGAYLNIILKKIFERNQG